MPRSVEEWIGKNDDTPIPPRVKLRIYDKYQGHCGSCGRKIVGKLKPAFDHIIALINGGQNRESNAGLLCNECHAAKSVEDVGEKSALYNKRIGGLGFKNKKLIPVSKGSGFRKTISGKVWRES
jgi:5-methylcytosine-specific restriction endonuclease McrA